MPQTYVLVEFESGGKQYLYSSPFTHNRGDLLIVNTYGKLRVVRVMDTAFRRETLSHYDGPISSIEGVAYLFEDLANHHQTQTPDKPTSIFDWFKSL